MAMNGSCATVLGTLAAFPSDDTVLAIAGHSGLSAPEVEATLGDLKRLELARSLATQPKLLLLDEVMGGLNPTEMDEIVGLVARLRSRGMTIVVVEHIMDAITALADDLVVLSGGQVLARGAPAEVLRDARVIEAYLGRRAGAAA